MQILKKQKTHRNLYNLLKIIFLFAFFFPLNQAAPLTKKEGSEALLHSR